MLPLMLDLRDKWVVVVGGGAVGQRKARKLRNAGAKVRVVSLSPAPADGTFADCEWIEAPVQPHHLSPAWLVVAAATAAVNEWVTQAALELGLWVCRADAPEAGNVQFPATLTVGPMTLAISTAGVAPALARRLCEQWSREFDATFAAWLHLLEAFRPLIRRRVSDEKVRRDLYERFSTEEWYQRFRRDGADAVRFAMEQIIADASPHPCRDAGSIDSTRPGKR